MKKILFIGLPYHSYIGAISHEMELMGTGRPSRP